MFHDLQVALKAKYQIMKSHPCFTVTVSKDDLWTAYLGSFPSGSDPIHKTNTVHDCNCCKTYIRRVGGLVAIIDGKLVSLWDIEVSDPVYQTVADTMSDFIGEHSIRDIFISDEQEVGAEETHKLLDLVEGETVRQTQTYNHFYLKLKDGHYSDRRATLKGDARTNAAVLQRSLEEFTLEAIEAVIDLITSDSLYRGEEQLQRVQDVLALKKEYMSTTLEKEVFIWGKAAVLGVHGKYRNTAIGTLLTDLSEDVALEVAVKKFEDKVSGTNYKRPKALATPGMIKKAEESLTEKGYLDSLPRRHAQLSDIEINDVIWADNEAKQEMSIFGELAADVATVKAPQNEIEIAIAAFMTDVLPTATKLDLLVENSHVGNLVSLIAPVHEHAKSLTPWTNNFTHSYAGEMADAVKQNVKAAGGNIVAKMRGSLQWNEQGDNNQCDYDLHCIEPCGNKVYYPSNGQRHRTTALLDVDNTNPGMKVAIENITWDKVAFGTYRFLVHNFRKNGNDKGFTFQFEYENELHELTYNKPIGHGKTVTVISVTISAKGAVLSIGSLMSANSISKEEWGIKTKQYHRVETVMFSPNFWGGEGHGNKHHFFMLENCKNPLPSRGFYNEFLNAELQPERRVMEMLASKMRVPFADDQLSGLGFSSTVRNSVTCRVNGSQHYKIKF